MPYKKIKFGLLTAKYDNFLDYANKALNKQLIGDTTFDENKIKEYLKSSQNDNKEYKETLKTNNLFRKYFVI